MKKELQIGEQIIIGDAQYIAVKAVKFSCKGCVFYKPGRSCGQEDLIVALCIGGNIIFKNVKQ